MTDRTSSILRNCLLAALIIVGGYTFLYYLGMPVHRASLLMDADTKWVDAQCSSTACQGLFAIIPFIKQFVARLGIFAPYLILSLLAGVAFYAVQYARHNTWNVKITVRPIYILGGFLLALWLLHTTFTFSSMDGAPFTRIAQPDPSIYRDSTPEGIKALQENFDALKNAGCLSLVGYLEQNVGVYDIGQLCFQKAFFSRVFVMVLVAGVFLFEMLIVGHSLLSLLRRRPRQLYLEAIMSLGLGVFAWIAILWTVAVLGIFDVNVGWLLVLAFPIACYRAVLYWAKVFWNHSWEVDVHPKNFRLVLAWLLVTYLAVNFYVVVRPFPIGWDDLGSYLNRPRLLVSYGHFIHTMATFQWEYLTSMGFLLFGYSNPVGATASMIINWTEGLIAVLVVLSFGRALFGKGRGLLSALLFYTLPLIGHFSFADMKIDNAVFSFSALALLMMFVGLFSTKDDVDEEAPHEESFSELWIWFLLAGLFAGLALGMKATAAMVVMALFVVFVGGRIHWLGALGMVFATLGAFAKNGNLSAAKIFGRILGEVPLSQTAFTGLLFIIALLFLGVALWKTKGRNLRLTGKLALCLIGGMMISVAPWSLYNSYLYGSSTPHLFFSAPDTLTPSLSLDQVGAPLVHGRQVRGLPLELKVDLSAPACKATGSVEELDRYWGAEQGFWHYAALPWRSVMNIDIGGYYVTTIPALLLFPLVLLLPLFWDKRRKAHRYIALATAFLILEWTFLANGIPWYGVSMFLGLSLCLEMLFVVAPDRWTKHVTAILLTLSLFMALGMRLWQFEMQQNLIEYPTGKISASALEQRTIPWYGLISSLSIQRYETLKEQPYLYRIGTFIPYFLPKNLEVVGFADHQLDNFNCLYQERDAKLTLKRLTALGFNSIVFDTNTATIENNPNGTLHKKVDAFVNFVNTPGLGIKVVVSDLNAGVAYALLPPN